MSGFEEITLRFTQAVAHFLWIAVVLWLVAFLAERLMARSAAARHGVHLVGIMLMLVAFPLCFLFSAASESGVSVPEQVTDSDDAATTEVTTAVMPESTVGRTAEPVGGNQTVPGPVNAEPFSGSGDLRAEPVSFSLEEQGVKDIDRTTTVWRNVGPWVTGVYFLGLALMLVRLIFGWAGSARLRKRAVPIASGLWHDSFEKVNRWFRSHGEVVVAWSREVGAPVVMGVVKPMILVPVALANRLTPAQVEAVLAHELAHLHRRDHWAVMVQRLVETLLFFHPAVWWMSRRMESLREEACDDYVVAAGCDPADYAEALVVCSECRLERGGQSGELAQSLAVTGKKGAPLKQRVLRLLDQADEGPVRLGRVGWVLAGLALGGVAMSVLVGGMVREDLADFDFDDPPSGYEKGIEVADAQQEYRVDGLRFAASPLRWETEGWMRLPEAEQGSGEELFLDLGVADGFEIVDIRLFDHATRDLIHTDRWQRPGDHERKFFAERIGSTRLMRIQETGGILPGKIDVWLRLATQASGPVFKIPAKEGASVTQDGSELVVTKLFAGSANGRGGPTGEMVWDATTVHNQDREVTLNIQNRGEPLNGRFHLVAVTHDEVRHPMDSPHFCDFGRSARGYAYFQLYLPLEHINHFELIPFKGRHKFFFNGLDVPRRPLPVLSGASRERLERWRERYEAGELSKKNFLLFIQQPSDGPDMVPALIEWFDDPRFDALAMKAIEQFKDDPMAVAYLVRELERMSDEPEHAGRNAGRNAGRMYGCLVLLGKMGDERHVDLIASFIEKNPLGAIWAFESLKGEKSADRLVDAFDHVASDQWWLLARVLGNIGEPSVLPELKRRLAQVEALPSERFGDNAVPVFIKAIRKLSGEGDGDSGSIIWQQGQHFVFPFDGPGSPKSFSVHPPRDHYVRLPEVDPATDAGRDAIWKAFAEKTEGPGFTIDGDEMVLFNGLRAVPLWEDGPPYPTTMFDWLERVSHRELLARAKVEAALDRVKIPDSGYLLALDPQDRLYGLSLKKTTDDPQYNVGLRVMDPLRQLIRPSPQASGPYTDWRGFSLHDLESGAENGALNLNRGHMMHLEEKLFREPGSDAILTAEFASGKIALGVPWAEEFVLVEAEPDLQSAELVQRLSLARLKKPTIEGHSEVGDREWRGHQFERLESDRSFGFAIRMPDGIPVAGLLVVKEVDTQAETVSGKHVMLFTDLARKVFEGPVVHLKGELIPGDVGEDRATFKWQMPQAVALDDYRLALQFLTIQGHTMRSRTSNEHALSQFADHSELFLELNEEVKDDGRQGSRWILKSPDGEARSWVPVVQADFDRAFVRDRVSTQNAPLLWVPGQREDLLVVGSLVRKADRATLPEGSVKEMLAQLEAEVLNFHRTRYEDSGAKLTMVDSSGQPISGVRVQFDEQAKTIKDGQSGWRNVPVWEGVSDASGQVPIPNAKSDRGSARLWVRAEADGYVSRWSHYDRDLRSRPDGTWEDQRYLLLKAGVLSGRVLDAEGRPLSGAPLSVSTHCNFEDHWQGEGDAPHGMSAGISNHLRAITDEKGEFRIEGVPPGSAMVYYPWEGPLAGEDARWAKWSKPDEPYPQPPVTDRAWVRIPSLKEGEEINGLEADLAESTAVIEGVVLDGRRNPVPDASVWVVWKAGNFSNLSLPWSFEGGRFVTGADGKFRLSGLPPGEAGLLVKHKDLKSPKNAVPVQLKSRQSTRASLSLGGALPENAAGKGAVGPGFPQFPEKITAAIREKFGDRVSIYPFQPDALAEGLRAHVALKLIKGKESVELGVSSIAPENFAEDAALVVAVNEEGSWIEQWDAEGDFAGLRWDLPKERTAEIKTLRWKEGAQTFQFKKSGEKQVLGQAADGWQLVVEFWPFIPGGKAKQVKEKSNRESATDKKELPDATYLELNQGEGLELDGGLVAVKKIADQGVDVIFDNMELVGRDLKASVVKLPYEVENMRLTASHIRDAVQTVAAGTGKWPLRTADDAGPTEVAFVTQKGTAGVLSVVGYTSSRQGEAGKHRVKVRLLPSGPVELKDATDTDAEGDRRHQKADDGDHPKASKEVAQVSLGAPKLVWTTDETPVIKWSVRNLGQWLSLQVVAGQRQAQLEIDGVWYQWPQALQGERLEQIPAGESLEEQLITLGPIWSRVDEDELPSSLGASTIKAPGTGPPLILKPDTLSVRVAVVVDTDLKESFRVISPSMELEVQEPPASADVAWPPQVEVVQAVKNAVSATVPVLQASDRSPDDGLRQSIDRALESAGEASKLSKGTVFEPNAGHLVEFLAEMREEIDKRYPSTPRYFWGPPSSVHDGMMAEF
jgi:beta-lactamase regulating signal transducer with metallopeptidase domain/protocatechuate 3,4-dioxygenase beta subunit